MTQKFITKLVKTTAWQAEVREVIAVKQKELEFIAAELHELYKECDHKHPYGSSAVIHNKFSELTCVICRRIL